MSNQFLFGDPFVIGPGVSELTIVPASGFHHSEVVHEELCPWVDSVEAPDTQVTTGCGLPTNNTRLPTHYAASVPRGKHMNVVPKFLKTVTRRANPNFDPVIEHLVRLADRLLVGQLRWLRKLEVEPQNHG